MNEARKTRVFLCVPNHGLKLEQHEQFSAEHLGVAYLAAELCDTGFAVEVHDAYLLNMTSHVLTNTLATRATHSDIVCFTTTLETAPYVKDVSVALRASGFGGAIVVGGWGVALAPHSAAAYFQAVDVLWCGWSSEAFASSVARLASLAGRRERVVLGAASSLTPPRTSWQRPQHYAYTSEAYSAARIHPIPLLGGIGCYWGRCAFCCSAARWSNRLVQRDVADIVDELVVVSSDLRCNCFNFVDDCFFDGTEQGKQRAKELARILCDNGTNFTFSLDCRVADIAEDVFAALRRAGLRSVFLGIESGSSGVLQRYRKGHTVKQAKTALEILRRLDVDVTPGYITFDPEMSSSELAETVAFLKDNLKGRIDDRMRNKLRPYPGTTTFLAHSQSGLLSGCYPEYRSSFADPDVGVAYRCNKNLQHRANIGRVR